MIDLYQATREELIGMVVAQRLAYDDLERRCAELTQQVEHLQATVALLTEQVGRVQGGPGERPGVVRLGLRKRPAGDAHDLLETPER